MPRAIQFDRVSKLYRLGEVSTGTLAHDLNRWFHRLAGKDDPYGKIALSNERENKTSNGSKTNSNQDYVWALRDISFSVEKGEILGVIGRNGAGKSTLLKLLSRVTAPTDGFIHTKGRIASLLEVGTGFHPELTGRENIYLNGTILGMRRHEISKQFDNIIDFSGCAKYVDTPVKRYSSGMTVRLGFAVAAHLEAEILVVDEVLAVGDAEFQKRCLGKIRDIRESSGRTILFVSHNMDSLRSICTRGVVIERGQVAKESSIHEAIQTYTDHTKDLLTTDSAKQAPGFSRITASGAQCSSDGSCIDFTVNLTSQGTNTVFGIALILTTLNGFRVLVADLRSHTSSTELMPNQSLSINFATLATQLVEGTYSIGLYIQSSTFTGDVEHVGYLETSLVDSESSGVIPFPAQYRGVVHPRLSTPSITIH